MSHDDTPAGRDDARPAWKTLAQRAGMRTEGVLEKISTRFRDRFRPDLPLHILPFGGFGTGVGVSVSGRVTEYREPVSADPDTLWGALQHSYRRFDSREVPGIEVEATVGAHTARATSDEEGYFTIDLAPGDAGFDTPDAGGRLDVALDLPGHASEYSTATTRVLVPADTAEFGVISDIDDTVLVTNATSLVHMMRLTLLQSSAARLAFPGVAAFYEALHAGRNPFFYVSSSPWNLHEFLEDFFEINGIVPGPLLLRDYGIDETKLIAGSHHAHKLDANRRIFRTYPDMSFILIGDSGQDDPEIYSTLLADNPDRVKAIYIRDVSNQVRDNAVQQLMQAADERGVDMLLVPDTLAAARHAATRGYIDSAALPAIASAVADDQLPGPVE